MSETQQNNLGGNSAAPEPTKKLELPENYAGRKGVTFDVPPPAKFSDVTEAERAEFKKMLVPEAGWSDIDGKGSANSTQLEPTPTHPGLTDPDVYGPDEQDPKFAYDFVHKPKHYALLEPSELLAMAQNNEPLDVCAVAEAAGLDKDAYMFMVLKYVLRQNKPGEPRRRDVEKIREYCDIWLKADNRRNEELADED